MKCVMYNKCMLDERNSSSNHRKKLFWHDKGSYYAYPHLWHVRPMRLESLDITNHYKYSILNIELKDQYSTTWCNTSNIILYTIILRLQENDSKNFGGLNFCTYSPSETQGGIHVIVNYRVIDCLHSCMQGPITSRMWSPKRSRTFFKVKGDCHLNMDK